MSESLGLGKIITTPQQRDAIHVAVAPVVAAEKLSPGQDIGFVDGSTERVGSVKVPIGIVDPFLKKLVHPEQKFWMYLYPGTITSLRHDWTHPAFGPSGPNAGAAEAWIRAYAREHCDGLSYEDIMAAAWSYLHYGNYLIQGGRFEGIGLADEFWDYYEIATGEKVSDGKRGSFFSCSCG